MRLLVAVLLTSAALTGGSLSIRVSNSVTGAGIPGIRFKISCYTCGVVRGNTEYTIVSDASGAFHVGSLPDGQYAMDNLETKGFQITGSTPIRVSGDSQFELQLTPNANIRGRVFDPEGNPAVGVSVGLSRVFVDGLGHRPDFARLTDKNGEFLMEGVGAASGLILTATPSAQAVAKTVSKDGTRLVTTYFPSAITVDQAARINITGVDASYDIHLQTAPARAIKGVVMDVSGKPAPHASVSIFRNETLQVSFIRGMPSAGLGSPVTAGVPPVETDEDGTFAFPSVLEGDWTLSAFGSNFGEPIIGTARISVSTRDAAAGDISNVQIQLAKYFDLELTADWGDANPPRNEFRPFFLFPISLDPGIPRIGLGTPLGEPGQPQHLHLFPGRFFIGAGNPGAPGFYGAAAMLDGSNVLGQVVELSGSASIKIIFKSGGGSVHGTVEKGPGASVVLLADATPDAVTGYMGRCDENGAFTISDLPPGEYTAVAVPSANIVDPRAPNFTTAAIRDGKRVKVEAGSAAQVDLRVSVLQ